MPGRYYLIRTPTLAEINNAISQAKNNAEFPSLRVTDGKDLHYIYHQTLADIADVIRDRSGTTGEIPVTSLAARIIALDESGEEQPSDITPAILGKAILGRTILGKTTVLEKLGTPIIRLELGLEKLSAPVIYLHTEDDSGDEPIVPAKLAAPVIRLEVIEDEVHTHDYTAVVTAPTCTEGGYTTYTCTDCGEQYVDDVTAALGHSFGEPYYSAEFSTGYGRKCSRCGELEDMTVPVVKLDAPVIHLETVEDEVHTHDYAVVVTDPTCTEDGYTTYTCVDCGHTYAETIPATGHDWGEPYYSDEFFTGYGCACNKCGELNNLDAPMSKLDTPVIHLYEETYVNCEHTDYTSELTKPVSCTEDGIVTCTCKVCGYQWTNTLSSAGHYYESVVTDPTCTTGGYTTHTCVDCGDSYIDNETDALGHEWGEPYYSDEFSTGYGRKCSRCGELENMTAPLVKLDTPSIYLDTGENEGETVVVFDGELTVTETVVMSISIIRMVIDGELLSADVKHYTLSIDGVATKLGPSTNYLWAAYNFDTESVYMLQQTDGRIIIPDTGDFVVGETRAVRITYNTNDCVPFLFKPYIKLETIA